MLQNLWLDAIIWAFLLINLFTSWISWTWLHSIIAKTILVCVQVNLNQLHHNMNGLWWLFTIYDGLPTCPESQASHPVTVGVNHQPRSWPYVDKRVETIDKWIYILYLNWICWFSKVPQDHICFMYWLYVNNLNWIQTKLNEQNLDDKR